MNINSIVENYSFDVKLLDLKPLLEDPTVQLMMKTVSHLVCLMFFLAELFKVFSGISILQFFQRLVHLYL